MFKRIEKIIKSFFASKPRKQPEDDYIITLSDDEISVINPQGKTERVQWSDIHTILLLTTDQGPFLPDVWFVLMGTQGGCVYPQGAPNYEEVYERISKFDGFDYDVIINAMSITKNEEHVLWQRKDESIQTQC